MKRDIRILLGYCPVYGRDLSHELIKLDDVSFCYNATAFYCYEEEDGKIVNFNQNLARNSIYEKVFDLNKLPALNEELMEQMLPYESMAIKLAWRRTNFPIVEYEAEKRNYLRHLRFWNYIIEEYKINALFFEETPHVSYTYIIYCLGVIKDIPILMCDQTNISGVRIYGNRIEQMGADIQYYYENVASKMNISDCILEGQIEQYYEKYKNSLTEVKAERKKSGYEKAKAKKIKQQFFGEFLGKNLILKPLRKKIYLITQAIGRENGIEWYRKHKDEVKKLKKDCNNIIFLMRNMVLKQKQYDKIAMEPDYGEKYIYFALQLTPEGTVIPRAGVFSEQYTSIQLLAKAAQKENVWVYVKEHFLQPFREQEVYEILDQIPNVRLIKSSVSSFDLMKHSVAAATQTGSCILESALMGKPVLVTSKGYFWKGLCSVFEVVNEEQGSHIIHKLLNGFEANQDDVKKYFYSIQKNSLSCYIQEDWMNQSDKLEHKESVKNMMVLLRQFVRDMMKEC